MKDEEVDPLDPALGSLFDDERSKSRAPAGARERVLRRLEASIGPLGSGGDGGAGNGGGDGGSGAAFAAGHGIRLLPLLGALLIGGAAGALIVARAMPTRVVYVDRVVQVPASAASFASTEPAIGIAMASAARSSSTSEATAAPSSSGASRDGALAAERAILDIARTALGRGDAPHALGAVERHTREFPQGQMTEEREAIAVQALVKLGRKEEAAVRGARFRKRYPNSVLAPVIDAALDSGDAQGFQ